MDIEILAPILFLVFFIAGFWIIKTLGKKKRELSNNQLPQATNLNSLLAEAELSRKDLFGDIAEDFFRSSDKKKIDLYVKWLPAVEEHFEKYKAVYMEKQNACQHHSKSSNNVIYLFSNE